MTNKHLMFDIDSAEVVEENENSQFATIRIFAFSSGWNRHDLFCSVDTLKNTAKTIYDKPVVYSFSKLFRDFDTHNDPDKSLIAGFVVRDSAEFVDLEDGRTSLSVLAKIWKMYAPQFMQLLQESQDHEKKVSVEMELRDSVEIEKGEEMLDFEYSAVCVLGDLITEASPGAHLEVLSFAKQECQKAFRLEFSRMYDEIDFTIPEEVKNNAKKGLELRKKYGRGGTSVGLATARYLIKNKVATPEKVRHVAKYFPRHAGDNLTDKTSNGWIAWLLWGSNAGRSWSTKIVDRMNELDEKEMAYFSNIENFEKVTFPYKDKSEMNPALKGINPPISVSQANSIAKQADAIGSDESKNGWAIAIANFKKTHKVENGKWVRKETKNMEEEKNFEEKQEEEKEETLNNEAPPKEEENKENMSDEKFEEEKEESEDKEEDEDSEKEEMSLDANLDVKAVLAFLQEETEDYQSLVAEFSDEKETKDFSKMAYYMYGKMKEMAEKLKKKEDEASSYMAENEELKKYKNQKEEEQFTFSVDTILKEIEGKVKIPKEELSSLKEKSKEFSLDTLSAWENLAKAKALDFAVKDVSKESEEPRYAWGSQNNNKPANSSFWK